MREEIVRFYRVHRRFSRDGGSRTSAALAYYALFALAPTLLLAVAATQLFVGSQAAAAIITDATKDLLGQSLASRLAAIVAPTIAGRYSAITGIIGLVTSIGASGIAFYQLQGSINSAFGLRQKEGASLRQVLPLRLRQMLLILLPAGLLVAVTIGSRVLGWLGRVFSRIPAGDTADVLGSPWMMAAAAWVSVTVLYAWLPDATVRLRDAWHPALVFAIAWAAGTYLFGFYLEHAGTRSAGGAVGTVFVLLIWMNYSARALLFGAAVCRDNLERSGAYVPRPYAEKT